MLECIEHAVKHGHLRFKWQSVKNCSLLWGQLYFYMTQTLTQKITELNMGNNVSLRGAFFTKILFFLWAVSVKFSAKGTADHHGCLGDSLWLQVHQWLLARKIAFPQLWIAENVWKSCSSLPSTHAPPAPHVLGIWVLWLSAQLRSLHIDKNLLYSLRYSTVGGGAGKVK